MHPNQLNEHLPDMAVFVRVVDCAGFSAAARTLGLTPSAVSRMVSRLEKALGLRLLERSTRQLRLTGHGSEVLAQCRAMLGSAQSVLDIAQQAGAAPGGSVRISAPKAFGRRVLHPLLGGFLARYPEVSVQLLLQDALLNPVHEEVDLMVRICEAPPEHMVARALLPVRQLLCASPAYLAARGVPRHPRELDRHACLSLGERAHDNSWHLCRGEENVRVGIDGRYRCNHSEVRLEAMLDGLGIACLPDFIAADAIARGQAVCVLDDWRFVGPYQGTAWLLSSSARRQALKCRVLIDYLAAALAQRPAASAAKQA